MTSHSSLLNASVSVSAVSTKSRQADSDPEKSFSVRSFEPKPLGDDRYQFTNGDVWEFTAETFTRNQILNTRGNYTIASTGTMYSGLFTDGKLRGEGKASFPDGSRLSAIWSGTTCEGTMYFSSGDIYSGELVEGMRDGYGICEYVTGTFQELRTPYFSITTCFHACTSENSL